MMSFSLLSIANALKGIFMLLLTKIVALSFGPSGIAALGSFQNILGIVGPISSLGANSATTLFISKSSNKEIESTLFSLRIILFIGFLTGLSFLIFFWSYFLESVPKDLKLNSFILTIYCFFSSVFALVSGYLQGKTLFKQFAYGTIIGSIINILLIAWAFQNLSFNNTIYLASFQVVIYALVFCFILRKKIGILFFRINIFRRNLVLPVIKIGFFSLLSGIVLSLVFIEVRNHIILTTGINAAGNWDAAMKIFPIITLLVCMPIFTRYFSELCNTKNFTLIISLYKKILKAASLPLILGLLIVYFFPNLIVNILFSDSFKLYKETILLFVVGDVIRSYAVVLNYLNLAFERYFQHFIGEITFSISLICLISSIELSSFLSLAYLYLYSALSSLLVVIIFCIISIRGYKLRRK